MVDRPGATYDDDLLLLGIEFVGEGPVAKVVSDVYTKVEETDDAESDTEGNDSVGNISAPVKEAKVPQGNEETKPAAGEAQVEQVIKKPQQQAQN